MFIYMINICDKDHNKSIVPLGGRFDISLNFLQLFNNLLISVNIFLHKSNKL
jgi:hypothetical protein